MLTARDLLAPARYSTAADKNDDHDTVSLTDGRQKGSCQPSGTVQLAMQDKACIASFILG